jgi:hypothetical protein
MKLEKIPVKKLYFVDAVSYLMGSIRRDIPRSTFIESPTMLETIMLKTDYFIKQIKGDDKFALFDSISGLSIYNDEKMVQEFIHILTNTMRMKDINTILLSVKEQTSPGIDSMLRLNCDDTLEVGDRQAEASAGPESGESGEETPEQVGRYDIPRGGSRDPATSGGFGGDDMTDMDSPYESLDGDD